MKLFIKFLSFILFLFLLNIIFYFLSDSYKIFLQELKYSDEIIDFESGELKENEKQVDNYQEHGDNYDILKIDNKNLDFEEEVKFSNDELKKEVILGNNYNEILNLFKNEYALKKIEINSTLFELTDEYPDYYYEYYSKELTLYIFPTKNYNQIFDIFNYLQASLPFSINENNNFGEKSFYINLREDVIDNYIRIVVSKNGVDFGLKIKKEEYKVVKEILGKLK